MKQVPMKKNAVGFIVCLLLFFSVEAQVRVAMTAGPQSATVKENNDLPDWDVISKNYSSRIGIQIGFIADLPISNNSQFYFQPGLMISNKGRKFAANYDSSFNEISNINGIQFINYIELPLNFVFKKEIGKKNKLLVGAGPYFSFFYDGKEKTETFYKSGDFEIKESNDLPVGNGAGKYKTMDFGADALIGIEFRKAFITARYSRGLSSFYKSNDYDGTFKHIVVGATVGIFLGKPMEPVLNIKDKDRDGIPDKEDNCPTQKGTFQTLGCPDKDGDGIADKDDNCSEVPGKLKYHGCPVPDSDMDSVNDDEDECPKVYGLLKYKGCPVPDTDHDGINDESDKCPTISGIQKYNGCPVPDSDNDSVNDDEDKCPDVAGLKENNGCPEIEKEIIKKIEFAASKIQFKIESTVILPESYKVLDDIVSILKENPDLKLLIEGHTSIDGNANFNFKLSQTRADNVKKYLGSKGIETTRLTAVGFGTTKPLNNSKNEVEKALNRRVELKLSN
jgi:outer membrane protein OmpA-like peptidoglycan-associated protein